MRRMAIVRGPGPLRSAGADVEIADRRATHKPSSNIVKHHSMHIKDHETVVKHLTHRKTIMKHLRPPYESVRQKSAVFLVISMVIDSDRGHCYEHLKKMNFRRKLSS